MTSSFAPQLPRRIDSWPGSLACIRASLLVLGSVLATLSFAQIPVVENSPGASENALTVEAQATLAKLEQLLEEISSLSADVNQLIVESDGGILEESTIKMHMLRPNGFYWETITPFPQLIVTDGETLWNYEPDLEQVVIEDWNSGEAELTAQLLHGNTASLMEDYYLSSRPSDTGIAEFELLPKDPNSVYTRVNLTFVDAQLDMIYVDSTNGQKTVWQFLNLQQNPTLDTALFSFEAPQGVEVIENSYSQ